MWHSRVKESRSEKYHEIDLQAFGRDTTSLPLMKGMCETRLQADFPLISKRIIYLYYSIELTREKKIRNNSQERTNHYVQQQAYQRATRTSPSRSSAHVPTNRLCYSWNVWWLMMLGYYPNRNWKWRGTNVSVWESSDGQSQCSSLRCNNSRSRNGVTQGSFSSSR